MITMTYEVRWGCTQRISYNIRAYSEIEHPYYNVEPTSLHYAALYSLSSLPAVAVSVY